MHTHYPNINFVRPDDLGYKKWCHRHAQIRRLSSRNSKHDPFEFAFNKQLIEWEKIVQKLLSKVVIENKNRILQFSKKSGATQYREIDFITKTLKDKVVLCEIKLKQTYKEKDEASNWCKFSGWKQLNKSLAISSRKYNNIAGLSICVDMSHLYGIDSTAMDDVFCKYGDIKKYFDLASTENNVIWLNSLEIARLAVENNFITNKEVDSLKKIFNERNDPLSTLIEGGVYYDNKPFEALLINNHIAS